MDIQSTTTTISLFFLFILLSGFWVSRSGKPYNTFIFTIHKLIGLAAGVYLIRSVYQSHQAVPLVSAQWTAIMITVLLFVITVAAGGLLSVFAEGNLQQISEPAQNAIELVHKFSPYLIVLSTSFTFYLLFFSN